MRSGLFNYSETLELNELLTRPRRLEWTPQDLLDLAFSNPPYFAPGEGYHYLEHQHCAARPDRREVGRQAPAASV